MNFIKNIFKDKKPAFYCSLAVALINVITAVIYSVSFFGRTHLQAFVSWMPPTFLVVGALAFVVGTIFKFSQIGAVGLAIFTFASFVSYLSTIYGYPVEQIMVSSIDKVPEFGAIVVCAALMLIGFITANVCAWKKHEKTVEDQKDGE